MNRDASCAARGVSALHRDARCVKACAAPRARAQVRVLDIGGRKSHYTIGIPAKVTITELERQSNVQRKLHLGMTEEISTQIQRRRSNIDHVVIDDMTRYAVRARRNGLMSLEAELESIQEPFLKKAMTYFADTQL